MVDLTQTFDVLIAGGGNAALCAAITARRAGASVVVAEHAPKDMRGGNSRHTRNCAVPASRPDRGADRQLPRRGILGRPAPRHRRARPTSRSPACASAPASRRRSFSNPAVWCSSRRLSGTLSLSRTNAFFLGGGKALINALYRTAEALGITILYDTEVQHIEVEDGFATEAIVSHRGFPARIRFKAFHRLGRRLPGEPRMAAQVLGRRRRQFPDPRHALRAGRI